MVFDYGLKIKTLGNRSLASHLSMKMLQEHWFASRVSVCPPFSQPFPGPKRYPPREKRLVFFCHSFMEKCPMESVVVVLNYNNNRILGCTVLNIKCIWWGRRDLGHQWSASINDTCTPSSSIESSLQDTLGYGLASA